MSRWKSSADLVCQGRGDRLKQLSKQVPDMKPKSSHQWLWSLPGHAAEVNAEPGGAIRIRHDVCDPPPPLLALTMNRDLPGNLRFAQRAQRSTLLADTQLDGEIHLSRTFDDVKAGLLWVTDGQRCAESPQTLLAEEVQSAIDDCDWSEEHVVQLEDAWEFRPRLRGNATPVQVMIDGAQLRLYRTVVADLHAAAHRDAVAEQALRHNDQLRHARLAVAGETLVAEARLHGQQLTPNWLEVASRAVAVACRYTEEVLNVLTDHSEIAEHYAAMFMVVEEESGGLSTAAEH